MKTSRHGSRHCGAVRFECAVDLAPSGQRGEPDLPGIWWRSSFRCNCSFHLKARDWKTFVRPADFRLIEGEDMLTEYRFGPGEIRHLFCSRCGVRTRASAAFDITGGALHTINLSTLGDVSPEEFAAIPITYEDGRNDAYTSPPAVTRHF